MLDYTALPQNPVLAIKEIFNEIHANRAKYFEGSYVKHTKISDLMITVSSLKHLANLLADDALISACDKMYSTINEKSNQYAHIQFQHHLASIATEIQKLLIDQKGTLISQELLFKINDNEKTRVLKLTAEIRAIITLSEDLDDSHKNRLFGRISAVEKEIHRPKGNFDIILAGVADFGDALGRFGENIKPLVDRYNEIRGITQSGNKEYEKLPPPDEIKKLPAPKK